MKHDQKETKIKLDTSDTYCLTLGTMPWEEKKDF